jgi:hypothetical protein
MAYYDSTARPILVTEAQSTDARRDGIADLEVLAQLLDARWGIPLTSIRFGVDALAGLLPVVGDAATGLVSAYIIFRARGEGASKGLIARMVGNVLLDTVVGSIPLLGSVFDVYFKSNKRNMRLLRRNLERRT